MKTLATQAKLLAVGTLAIVTFAFFGAAPAHAQSAPLTPDPSIIALEIVPVCSSTQAGTATWQVTNKNNVDVNIDWDNTQNGLTGSFAAKPGDSTLYTGYIGTDPNNTTQFTWAGNQTQTNAKAEECDPPVNTTPVPTQNPTPSCIDGHIQQNLVLTWIAKNKVQVHTLNYQPLCDDITVYFSSYTMPANYDGNSFWGNPTAYPQPIFDSASALLDKGTDGWNELTINLPDDCNNVQVDVYYAPEITTVDQNGHGTQNIESQVYLSTGACVTCPPITQPGQGSGTPPVVTPPVSQPPVTPAVPAASVELPATLPATGATVNPLLPATILAALTYGVMYARQRYLAAKARI